MNLAVSNHSQREFDSINSLLSTVDDELETLISHKATLTSNKAPLTSNKATRSKRRLARKTSSSAEKLLNPGVFIASVAPNSSADMAQLKQGDIITAFNGAAIRNTQDLNEIIQKSSVGEVLEVTYERLNRSRSTKMVALLVF